MVFNVLNEIIFSFLFFSSKCACIILSSGGDSRKTTAGEKYESGVIQEEDWEIKDAGNQSVFMK